MEKEYMIVPEMAERWGVSRQVVNNWAVRRKDFPKPSFELGAANKKITVYHTKDVIAFEEKHNLKRER